MNFNHCIFTGRIVQTPELKITPSGKNVCSFALAVENGYGDNKKVVFPNFIAWNGQAEFVAKLPKGTKISVAAQYDERSWKTNTGEKRKSYEFIVREIESHDKKAPEEQKQSSQQTINPDTKTPQYSQPAADGFENISNDDELPF